MDPSRLHNTGSHHHHRPLRPGQVLPQHSRPAASSSYAVGAATASRTARQHARPLLNTTVSVRDLENFAPLLATKESDQTWERIDQAVNKLTALLNSVAAAAAAAAAANPSSEWPLDSRSSKNLNGDVRDADNDDFRNDGCDVNDDANSDANDNFCSDFGDAASSCGSSVSSSSSGSFPKPGAGSRRAPPAEAVTHEVELLYGRPAPLPATPAQAANALRLMRASLATLLASERSRLLSSLCELVKCVAKVCPFVGAELFLAPLLRLVSRTNNVVVTRAADALMELAQTSAPEAVVRQLSKSVAAHPSRTARLAALDALHGGVFSTYESTLAASGSTFTPSLPISETSAVGIESALRSAVQDSAQDVRLKARAAIKAYMGVVPFRSNTFLNSLPQAVQKLLGLTVAASDAFASGGGISVGLSAPDVSSSSFVSGRTSGAASLLHRSSLKSISTLQSSGAKISCPKSSLPRFPRLDRSKSSDNIMALRNSSASNGNLVSAHSSGSSSFGPTSGTSSGSLASSSHRMIPVVSRHKSAVLNASDLPKSLNGGGPLKSSKADALKYVTFNREVLQQSATCKDPVLVNHKNPDPGTSDYAATLNSDEEATRKNNNIGSNLLKNDFMLDNHGLSRTKGSTSSNYTKSGHLLHKKQSIQNITEKNLLTRNPQRNDSQFDVELAESTRNSQSSYIAEISAPQTSYHSPNTHVLSSPSGAAHGNQVNISETIMETKSLQWMTRARAFERLAAVLPSGPPVGMLQRSIVACHVTNGLCTTHHRALTAALINIRHMVGCNAVPADLLEEVVVRCTLILQNPSHRSIRSVTDPCRAVLQTISAWPANLPVLLASLRRNELTDKGKPAVLVLVRTMIEASPAACAVKVSAKNILLSLPPVLQNSSTEDDVRSILIALYRVDKSFASGPIDFQQADIDRVRFLLRDTYSPANSPFRRVRQQQNSLGLAHSTSSVPLIRAIHSPCPAMPLDVFHETAVSPAIRSKMHESFISEDVNGSLKSPKTAKNSLLCEQNSMVKSSSHPAAHAVTPKATRISDAEFKQKGSTVKSKTSEAKVGVKVLADARSPCPPQIHRNCDSVLLGENSVPGARSPAGLTSLMADFERFSTPRRLQPKEQVASVLKADTQSKVLSNKLEKNNFATPKLAILQYPMQSAATMPHFARKPLSASSGNINPAFSSPILARRRKLGSARDPSPAPKRLRFFSVSTGRVTTVSADLVDEIIDSLETNRMKEVSDSPSTTPIHTPARLGRVAEGPFTNQNSPTRQKIEESAVNGTSAVVVIDYNGSQDVNAHAVSRNSHKSPPSPSPLSRKAASLATICALRVEMRVAGVERRLAERNSVFDVVLDAICDSPSYDSSLIHESRLNDLLLYLEHAQAADVDKLNRMLDAAEGVLLQAHSAYPVASVCHAGLVVQAIVRFHPQAVPLARVSGIISTLMALRLPSMSVEEAMHCLTVLSETQLALLLTNPPAVSELLRGHFARHPVTVTKLLLRRLQDEPTAFSEIVSWFPDVLSACVDNNVVFSKPDTIFEGGADCIPKTALPTPQEFYSQHIAGTHSFKNVSNSDAFSGDASASKVNFTVSTGKQSQLREANLDFVAGLWAIPRLRALIEAHLVDAESNGANGSGDSRFELMRLRLHQRGVILTDSTIAQQNEQDELARNMLRDVSWLNSNKEEPVSTIETDGALEALATNLGSNSVDANNEDGACCINAQVDDALDEKIAKSEAESKIEVENEAGKEPLASPSPILAPLSSHLGCEVLEPTRGKSSYDNGSNLHADGDECLEFGVDASVGGDAACGQETAVSLVAVPESIS